jgi:hypothetical protein
MCKEKKPKTTHKPKCARLINIAAKLEVVMARDMMERLGIYKLNAMNLVFVGLV